MRERLSFSSVDKWYGTHTGGVESGEKVDRQSEDGYTSRVRFVHEEHRSSPEKHKSHTGEGGEKKITSTKSVNCPNSRESEDSIDQSETERCEQTLTSVITSLCEDGGRIEGYREIYISGGFGSGNAKSYLHMMLIPQSCCEIITTQLAKFALLRRGWTNKSLKREKYVVPLKASRSSSSWQWA